MKYIIVIVLIVLLLVFLLSRPKHRNQKNSKSSNIILSASNPSSCYDSKEACEADCRGYRCRENCVRSTTQCEPGETGCYGSEEECKTGCTPIYKCNPTSGITTQYNVCATGETCYTGTLANANANCVKTYSCNGTNGCTLSTTFGTPCTTGATNCYNSQSACSPNCVKTYSCAGIGPTGATGCTSSDYGPPCASGATNCYTGSTSCTDACKGYRCTNCAVAGAKCDGNELGCFPTSTACSTSSTCPSVYKCSDNCMGSKTLCTDTEIREGKCSTSETECKSICGAKYKYNLTNNRCEEIYTPCEVCYNSITECNDKSKGFRCSQNCVQSIPCTESELTAATCYITETQCKTSCPGYRCGMTGNNIVCKPNIQREPCTPLQLYNQTCFITSNCLNKCDENVFSLIKSKAFRKYRIVNMANDRVLQNITDTSMKALVVNVKNSEITGTNPDQAWLFVNADWPSYFIVPDNSPDHRIGCINEICTTFYNHNAQTVSSTPWHKITIEPSENPEEFSKGICYLSTWVDAGPVYLGLDKVSTAGYRNDGNEYGWGGASASDPRYVVPQLSKNSTTKWRIIPI